MNLRRTFSWVLPSGIIVLAYLISFSLLPFDGFWINDNGCRFIQMEGLLRTGYADLSIPWPGKALDPSYSYNPLPPLFGVVVDGRLYGVFPVAFPLISTFAYRFAGMVGLYAVPLLGGLLTLPAVWILAGFVAGRGAARPLAVLIVGLCGPMWFYSMTFWEHSAVACLAAWSVVLFVRYLAGRGRAGSVVLGAALCGAAACLREEMYLWGAVLAVAAACAGRRGRHASVLFLAVLALCAAPVCLFHGSLFGHPLGPHGALLSPLGNGIRAFLNDRLTVVRNLLVNSCGNRWVSLAVSAPFLALFFFYPRVDRRAFNGTVMLLAAVGAASGLVVMCGHLWAASPIWYLLNSNGFFSVSPVLILALIRGPRSGGSGAGGDAAAGMLWLICILYVLAYLAVCPEIPCRGIHWGCRFLLPLYPLLGVLASSTIALSRPGKRTVARTMLLGLVIGISFALQVYSLHLLRERKSFSIRFNRAVSLRPERDIVALGWFIPQELAPHFYDRRIFLVREPRELSGLLGRLRRAGVRGALLVAWRRGGEVPVGEERVLDDGMNFVSVEIKPVSLAE